MARIAYILLTHKDSDGVIAQAERLTAGGDYVVIHFDRNASNGEFDKIYKALSANSAIAFTKRRLRCGWGEWGLVAATLLGLDTALDQFPSATHFYLLSGDCMPIKSAQFAHDLLDHDAADYIEAVDFFTSGWIKTGIQEERLIYRHYFNERNSKTWFYRSMEWQKRLGLTRKPPADLQIQIGSQWWCLRRDTVKKIIAFCKQRPDVIRFFSRTWIPDETFFQTLVRHLVPDHQIRSRSPTFLMFTDYGMPVTFYNDHYDLLLAQDYLFARKISPLALDLKQRLGALYTAEGVSFQISNEGRKLYSFLAGRGRVGRRFASRFWEREASLGSERRLLIVTCKKWHVAKRLIYRVQHLCNMPVVAYLYNESETDLPDLGGIQSTLEKRTRHRRALMRMMFDYWKSDRMICCIDPASIDLMHDFYNDKAQVRLLEIICEYSDDFLLGHATRVGLVSDQSPADTVDRLLPTIRYDVTYESNRLRDAGFAHHYRIRESADAEENAVPLAAFLGIDLALAREIAATPHLFMD